MHYLTQFIVTNFTCIKNNKIYFKTYVVLPVVCLHLVVAERIAHTRNAFGSLLLYVAHHDEEFVELLTSGHWLEAGANLGLGRVGSCLGR